ncbi:MAG TPA: serine hydrolase domain-containing protein [Gemmatimonadaceae bacterium]|jgi:CubicO group peptidase (beta-lactamase class C family)
MRATSLLRSILLVAAAASSATAQVAAPSRTPIPAVAGQPRDYASAIATDRQFIADTMRALGAPGASITVMKDGDVVWSEGFGWADVEQRVPVTPLTRFRIGSVSKSLTAIGLGLLVQEGKLDLDAPIQRYVPSFPTKRAPITARELAGHVAGIRHYRGNEMLIQRHYASVTEALDIFKGDTLLFAPGTRFSYSSYGFNLLSAVMERAAGEPFVQFMTQRVFEPLGLRHTVAEYADSLVPYRAHFYTHADSGSGIVNAPYVDNSYKWAGGGFLSTTDDLARAGQRLLDGALLKPETRRMLWTSQRTTDGKETGYGMGWFVDHDAAGRRRIYHSGGSVGGTAYLLIYPDERLVLALLVNSDYTFVRAAPRLAEAFLGAR